MQPIDPERLKSAHVRECGDFLRPTSPPQTLSSRVVPNPAVVRVDAGRLFDNPPPDQYPPEYEAKLFRRDPERLAKDFLSLIEDGTNADDQKCPELGLDEFVQPPKIKSALDDRQRDSLRRTMRHEEKYHAGVIAEDMGIGKTVISLACVFGNRRKLHTLIVVPSHLLGQWQQEMKKHLTPSVWWAVYSGRDRHDDFAFRDFEAYHIILTTYSMVQQEFAIARSIDSKYTKAQKQGYDTLVKMSDKTHLHAIAWGRIIVDEAHTLRNSSTLLSRGCRALTAWSKLAITGTPFWNNYSDFFSLLGQYLNLPMLGDWRFSNKYFLIRGMDHDIKRVTPYDAEEAQRYTLTCCVWAVMTVHQACGSFGAEEPVKQVVLNKEHITTALTRGSASFQVEIKHLFDEQVRQEEVLRQILWARAACIHETIPCAGYGALSYEPSTASEKRRRDFLQYHQYGGTWHSPRIDQTIADIKAFIMDERKILVFSPFLSAIDLLALRLMSEKIGFIEYNGRRSKARRDKVLDEFKHNPRINVLMMTIQSGGTGLNITAASAAIFMCPEWAFEAETQAICRALRCGQTRDVRVVIYRAEQSIEMFLQRLQDRKESKKGSIFDHHELTQQTIAKRKCSETEYKAEMMGWARQQIEVAMTPTESEIAFDAAAEDDDIEDVTEEDNSWLLSSNPLDQHRVPPRHKNSASSKEDAGSDEKLGEDTSTAPESDWDFDPFETMSSMPSSQGEIDSLAAEMDDAAFQAVSQKLIEHDERVSGEIGSRINHLAERGRDPTTHISLER